MTSPSHSETDREIDDTIRMYLIVCYTNAEDGREYTREELEESFASDTGLRTWATDVIGIDPDTLVPHTDTAREHPRSRLRAIARTGEFYGEAVVSLGCSQPYTFVFVLPPQAKPLDAILHQLR